MRMKPKILYVVADPVPESCADCPLLVLGAKLMCLVTRSKVADNVDDPMPCPPDCPMITKRENLIQALNQVHG